MIKLPIWLSSIFKAVLLLISHELANCSNLMEGLTSSPCNSTWSAQINLYIWACIAIENLDSTQVPLEKRTLAQLETINASPA